MSCHSRLPQCHVTLKSWPPGLAFIGRVLMSICEKKLWHISRSSLTHNDPNPRPGGRYGGAGAGRGDMPSEYSSGLQCEVTRTVSSPGTCALQYVIALYPLLQFYFPVASICQTGFSVCVRTSFHIWEGWVGWERSKQLLWNCNANIPLQSNH